MGAVDVIQDRNAIRSAWPFWHPIMGAVDVIVSDIQRRRQQQEAQQAQQAQEQRQWQRQDEIRKRQWSREDEQAKIKQDVKRMQDLYNYYKSISENKEIAPEDRQAAIGWMGQLVRAPGWVPSIKEELVPISPDIAEAFSGTPGFDPSKPVPIHVAKALEEQSREMRRQKGQREIQRHETTRQRESESHRKAMLIEKGMTKGWDSLAEEERAILGLTEKGPTLSNYASILNAIRRLLFDEWGSPVPGYDKELMRWYNELARKVTQMTYGMAGGIPEQGPPSYMQGGMSDIYNNLQSMSRTPQPAQQSPPQMQAVPSMMAPGPQIGVPQWNDPDDPLGIKPYSRATEPQRLPWE